MSKSWCEMFVLKLLGIQLYIYNQPQPEEIKNVCFYL